MPIRCQATETHSPKDGGLGIVAELHLVKVTSLSGDHRTRIRPLRHDGVGVERMERVDPVRPPPCAIVLSFREIPGRV